MKPIMRDEVERFPKLCCIASKADRSVTKASLLVFVSERYEWPRIGCG
jgi:hypothetical protein